MDPASHGEHALPREHATTTEQSAELPVRQSELRLLERVLTVDPSGEPITDKRGVDRGPEPVLLVGVDADQAGHEPR